MTQDTHLQTVLFPGLADRDILVIADEPTTSSDAGALLAHAAEKQLGFVDAFTEVIPDSRCKAMVNHPMDELLRQRMIGLACGYEDANDAARLRGDPVHSMIVSGDPDREAALASQPTLSRLENAIDSGTNLMLAMRFMKCILLRQQQRLHGRARRIMIDFDSTDDPTHGGQQLSLFNTYYGTWCYQTLLGFVRFNDEKQQHLVSATLLPGTGSMVAPAIVLLPLIVALLRVFFPHARICVRMDAGFAAPEMLDTFDALDLDFVLAMAGNKRLAALSEPYMIRARSLTERHRRTSRVYADAMYQAKTWRRAHRIIIKAEVVALQDRDNRDNARYVITNLPQSARTVYREVYAKRGDVENRIKELKYDMAIDRTSCSRYEANCFRVTMTAAAYAILQEMHRAARGTTLKNAQVKNLRLSVIKVAGRVVASARRIVVHLPETFAYLTEWLIIARRLGATDG